VIDIALRQGFSLYFLGRFAESVDRLLPHRARLEQLDDATLAGPYYFWLAHMYTRLGDQAQASATAHRAIEEARRCGDDATLGKAHGALALDGYWSGTSEEAIAHGRQAVARLEGTTQQWWLGMAHFYLAMNYQQVGRFPDALAATERARAVGEAISDTRLQCYAAFTSGWVAAWRGDSSLAVDDCERSRKLSPDRVSGVYASGFLGYAHVERGDAEPAIPLLEHAVRELEQFGFPQWHGMFTGALAEARRLSGDIATARELARRGLTITTGARYWLGVGYCQRVLARVAADAGDHDEAVARFTEALQIFESIGARFEVGRVRLELAERAWRRGARADARLHLTAAQAALAEVDAPIYAERVRQLAAELA
jgi:tetratricopeptide (TPR) repeat protein